MSDTPTSNSACPACGTTLLAGSTICTICGTILNTVEVPDTSTSWLSGGNHAPIDHFPVGWTLGSNGRYRIEKKLGAGGFGEAYRADDTKLKRASAIKHFNPHLNRDEMTRKQLRQDFEREAQLLVALNHPGHPNIPEIYEYLADDNCLVMKYIDGITLDKIVSARGGALTEAEALSYIRDICSVLVYMHNHTPTPVLHRDVKPTNVLLDTTGHIWVIDFGLSSSSINAGTPPFTPPEQWRGFPVPRSDVYALGMTLHLLLTGYKPSHNLVEPLPPVRSLTPTLSPESAALVEQATAIDVESRPNSAIYLAMITAALHKVSALRLLQAPDGTLLADEAALVSWCTQNWVLATEWLYNGLPDEIERQWGKTSEAAKIREIMQAHVFEQGAGLDAMLTFFDPQRFGAMLPSMQLIVPVYRRYNTNLEVCEKLVLANIGQRHVRAQMYPPAWMELDDRILTLEPGKQIDIEVKVKNGDDIPYGRQVLQVRSGTHTLAEQQLTRVRKSTFLGHVYDVVYLFPTRTVNEMTTCTVVIGQFLLVLVLIIVFSALLFIRDPGGDSNEASSVTPNASAWHWQPITSPEGRFAAEFPAEPTQQRAQGGLTIYQYVEQNVSFIIFYRDLSHLEIQQHSPEEILDQLQLRWPHWQGASLRSTSLSGHPGRIIRAENEQSTLRYEVRWYVVGNRLYGLMAVHAFKSQDKDNATYFLNSFKLIGS